MLDLHGNFTGYGWYDLLALEDNVLTPEELASTLEQEVLHRVPILRPYAPALFPSIREQIDDNRKYCRALVDLAQAIMK